MLTPLLSLLSAAAGAADPVPVTDIVWARPFTLEQPETWTMTAEPHPFTEGMLFELRVHPDLAAPRQGFEPILYVGEVPVWRFHGDRVGGCLVGFVPGKVDLAQTEVYFGDPDLPERIDRQRAAEARSRARSAGVRPLSAKQVDAALAAGGGPIAAVDLRDVHRVAMERVAACTSTPEDLQRAGVPADRAE